MELLESAGVRDAPVPIERVAEQAGFQVMTDRLNSDLSGFYLREGDQRVIGVNVFHPRVRQRFTIAHELGHALLEDHRSHFDRDLRLRDVESSSGTDVDEINANGFAAEILMPADWVREHWRQRPADATDEEWVVSAARHFNVSQRALLIRLGTLGFTVVES
jgi:Zn-dependent peptidase ImmA (M78 family)